MRRLLIATTNANKLREIRSLLADLSIEILTLADLPRIPEPEESARTFWKNARIKALAYAEASDLPTVAEDSGLEIDALDGEPGVYSARFLRPDASYSERFAEIYRRLAATREVDRTARFITALALAQGRELRFETETSVEGRVAPAPAGLHGFGYDPIFFYPPLARTTGELTDLEKSAISHRARAFRNLETGSEGATGAAGAAGSEPDEPDKPAEPAAPAEPAEPVSCYFLFRANIRSSCSIVCVSPSVSGRVVKPSSRTAFAFDPK